MFFFVKVNTLNIINVCIYFFSHGASLRGSEGLALMPAASYRQACGSSAVSVALLYFTLLSFASQDRGRDI